MKKALLVYATRFGATEVVAKELAKILGDRNVKVRLFDLKGSKDWPSPQNFDGVIVASSVARFRITKEAKKYIKKHAEILKDKPFGFVFCSAESMDHEEQAISKYVKIAVKPSVVRGVGVYFDLSESNKLGWVDKKILRAIAEGIAKNESAELNPAGKNDFLKHDRIRDFAHEFYTQL